VGKLYNQKTTKMIITILFTVMVAGIISLIWVRGIDYMMTNHKDYKGEDLFNEDKENL
jgi:hypothetical protein